MTGAEDAPPNDINDPQIHPGKPGDDPREDPAIQAEHEKHERRSGNEADGRG